MSYISSAIGVLLIFTLSIRTCDCAQFEVTVPTEPQLAVYGQSIVLPCTFPVTPGFLDLNGLIVTWQRNLEVVHSFYHGQDQLEWQSDRYASRTMLFRSELAQGNASLRLDNITPEDGGHYTCSISTHMGSQRKTFIVAFAAFYTEPQVHLSLSKQRVEILLSSQGFPKPVVQWFDHNSQDITSETVTEVTANSQGLYALSSCLTLKEGLNTNFTFILKNQALQQELRRELTLYMEKEDIGSSNQRERLFLLLPLALFMIIQIFLLLALWTLCQRNAVIDKA